MTSGYIPPKDEPSPEEILEALREAIFDNPRLTEMPAEEVAGQLVLGSHFPGWLLAGGAFGCAGGGDAECAGGRGGRL